MAVAKRRSSRKGKPVPAGRSIDGKKYVCKGGVKRTADGSISLRGCTLKSKIEKKKKTATRRKKR